MRRNIITVAATKPIEPPPPLRASEAQVQRGAQLFAQTCAVCHGQSAIGGVKDLRHLTADEHARFSDIVIKGTSSANGMASFADILKPSEVDDVHAYVIARANEDWGR